MNEMIEIGPVKVTRTKSGPLMFHLPASWDGPKYLRWKDSNQEILAKFREDGKRPGIKG